MNKILILTIVLLGMSLSVLAQHEHHKMPAKQDSAVKQKKTIKP